MKSTLTNNLLMRAAMTLLVVMMTATSAWAELSIVMNDETKGTFTVGPGTNCINIYVTPIDGYCVSKVVWKESQNATEMSTLADLYGFYECHKDYGIVYITFAEKTNDVHVIFKLHGHGGETPPDTQYLSLGNKVARPDTPQDADWTFIGWSTNMSGTKIYDFDTELTNTLPYEPAYDAYVLRLYAQWASSASLSGKCGNDLSWSITEMTPGNNDYNLLTISGTGDMKNYSTQSGAPWYSMCDKIKHIVINEGVTSIGKFAFSGCENIESDIVIPSTVTTIYGKAFKNVASTNGSNITIASGSLGSQLNDIEDYAFLKCDMNIDLSNAIKIKQFSKKKLNIFQNATGDVTLPSGMTLIEGKSYKEKLKINKTLVVIKSYVNTSFNNYKGNHVYINVPQYRKLFVNGDEYFTALQNDAKADLIDFLFINQNNRKTSLALSLSSDDIPKKKITIDKEDEADETQRYKYCEAFYYGGDAKMAEEAHIGEMVVLSWGGWDVPEGKYVSGFTFDVEGLTATPNDEATEYTFVMPDQDVRVTTLLSDQETYTLNMATAPQVVIPESVFILLNSLNGYYYYADEKYYLDLNLDGTPDLELIEPADEEEDDNVTTTVDDDDDEEDEENEKSLKHLYIAKRLEGANQLNVNYQFTPYYPPFPYRYNKIIVKCTSSNEVQEQTQIDDLIDNSDNSGTLKEWNQQTHSLIIANRTLYKDGKWNTLCLPFDLTIAGSVLDGTGVEARSLSEASISGTTLNLTFSDPVTTLQSGVPYIIKWDAAANLVNPLFKDVTIDVGEIAEGTDAEEAIAAFLAAKGYDNGADKGDNRVRFLGTFKDKRFDYVDKSILYVGADNTLYYPKAVLTPEYSLYPEIDAFRAYFKIGDGTTLARQLTTFNFAFGDSEAQGITTADFTNTSDVWYTLDGRKLDGKPSKHGVYIMNGRKVVMN